MKKGTLKGGDVMLDELTNNKDYSEARKFF